MEDAVKGYLIGMGLTLLVLVCSMFLFELAVYIIAKWRESREAKKIKARARCLSRCSSCANLGICAMAEAIADYIKNQMKGEEYGKSN